MTMFTLARFGGYGLEKGCLDRSCSAQPPQDARQSKYKLALHGRFGVIVANHRGFEGLIILCILEPSNDGLGGETVTDGVTA